MSNEFKYTREWTDEGAFPLLGFTKNWENPSDYPTYEPDEMQVRKDMQSLHDEVKDFLNNKLIPRVVAEDATVEAWTYAEEQRNANEGTRGANEEQRIANEAARVAAESGRTAAEQARTLAEQARVDSTTGVVVQATEQAADAARSATFASDSAEHAAQSVVDAQFYAQEADRAASNAAVEAENASRYAFDADRYMQQAESAASNAGQSATNASKSEVEALRYSKIAQSAAADAKGDMLQSVYDPTGKRTDIFAYADQRSNVQADWDQTSAQDPSFVRNRPFGKSTYIESEFGYTFEPYQSSVLTGDDLILKESGYYDVWLDDVQYSKLKATVVASGHLGLGYESNDIPFKILNDGPANGVSYGTTIELNLDILGTYRMHSLIVTHIDYEYQPLPDIYIPDSVVKVGDIYAKNEVVSNGTKAKFGYTTAATPDTILSKLGDFNQYCWLQRTNPNGYQEVLAGAVSFNTSNYDSWIFSAGSTSATYPVQYSDAISFNALGQPQLVNPRTINVSVSSAASVVPQLRGKYARRDLKNINGVTQIDLGVTYIPTNATYTTGYASGTVNGSAGAQNFGGVQVLMTTNQAVSSTWYSGDLGQWSVLSSASRNAYPDNGIVNGKEYRFGGVPFVRFAGVPQIETVQYKGTGTFGAANPCSLTFDFEPKVIMLVAMESIVNGSYYTLFGNSGVKNGIFAVFPHTLDNTYRNNRGFLVETNQGQYSYAKKEGNTIFWYATNNSAIAQANDANFMFYFIAIG